MISLIDNKPAIDKSFNKKTGSKAAAYNFIEKLLSGLNYDKIENFNFTNYSKIEVKYQGNLVKELFFYRNGFNYIFTDYFIPEGNILTEDSEEILTEDNDNIIA